MRAVACIFLLGMVPNGAFAEKANKPPTEVSLFVESEFPTLLDEIKISGAQSLEASVSVDKEAAKVTWAPWVTSPEYGWWDETRFELAQKDGVTSLGVAFKWNPKHPRSKRGGGVFDDTLARVPTLGPLEAALNQAIKDIDELISARLRDHSEHDGNLRDLVTQRDELQRRWQQAPDNELATIEKQIAEIEKQIAAVENRIRVDQLNVLRPELDQMPGDRALLEERSRLLRESSDLRDVRSSLVAQREQAVAGRRAKQGSAALKFYEALYTSSRPVVTVSYKTGFFSILDSDPVDADDDGLNDREHDLAIRSASVAADWTFSLRSQLSVSAGYTWQRPSAEADSEVGESRAFGVTYGHVIRHLGRPKEDSDDFIASGFIRSIVFGISVEMLECASRPETCVDGVDRKIAYTPFFDFKISPTAQFRLGFPVQDLRMVTGEHSDELSVISTIAFQMGKPN